MNKFVAISIFAAGLITLGGTFSLAIEKPTAPAIDPIVTVVPVEVPRVIELRDEVVRDDAGAPKNVVKKPVKRAAKKPTIQLDSTAMFCRARELEQSGLVGELVTECGAI